MLVLPREEENANVVVVDLDDEVSVAIMAVMDAAAIAIFFRFIVLLKDKYSTLERVRDIA